MGRSAGAADMTKRDKFKGQVIGRFMARPGATFEEAEWYYEAIMQQALKPVVAIVVGMIVNKVQRDYLGQDPISSN
jgi:uncharacterized protein YqgC (DUF456 family)